MEEIKTVVDTAKSALKDDKTVRWIILSGWLLVVFAIVLVFVSAIYLQVWFPKEPLPVWLADTSKVVLGMLSGLILGMIDKFAINSYKETEK
jgi:L-asparagine transporter-like permease